MHKGHTVIRRLLHTDDDNLLDVLVDLASLTNVGQKHAYRDHEGGLRILKLAGNLLCRFKLERD